MLMGRLQGHYSGDTAAAHIAFAANEAAAPAVPTTAAEVAREGNTRG